MVAVSLKKKKKNVFFFFLFFFLFFFFKQKTAYEISLGLVGSEMCIRDRQRTIDSLIEKVESMLANPEHPWRQDIETTTHNLMSVSYTHLTLPTTERV